MSKNFEQKPIISLPNWTEAFQYATRKKDIIKFRHSSTNDNTYYCLPVGDEAKLTEDYCKGYFKRIQNQDFDDFDDYKSKIHLLNYIILDKENWELSKCSCSFWMKNYYCKHIIYLATEKRLAEFKEIHKTIEIGKSRGPGRPSQTQSCYKRQETQEEESGTDTEDSEMKEKVNRRKVAVKEKRNKKNKIISINIIIKICL